ncbi:hypothetical protein M0805_002890 [Coniferiporia weirii]|nr:hypothetical protein M0805_002890 [Coniferiporia weirii]
MAKSMRSKVKRSFRAKKREEGVYAAVEAARLQRLSAKLQTVRETDRDGDVELATRETEAEAEAEVDGTVPGSCPSSSSSSTSAPPRWLLLLGLLEPGAVSFESLMCIEDILGGEQRICTFNNLVCLTQGRPRPRPAQAWVHTPSSTFTPPSNIQYSMFNIQFSSRPHFLTAHSTDATAPAETTELDGSAKTRISTHGPRGSRHEEWRTAKGLAPRPKSRGMNRQGGIAAKQRSGRPKRRR